MKLVQWMLASIVVGMAVGSLIATGCDRYHLAPIVLGAGSSLYGVFLLRKLERFDLSWLKDIRAGSLSKIWDVATISGVLNYILGIVFILT